GGMIGDLVGLRGVRRGLRARRQLHKSELFAGWTKDGVISGALELNQKQMGLESMLALHRLRAVSARFRRALRYRTRPRQRWL
ncbi:MAG: hypothetical protein ACJA1R_001493, partial [Flavobacteriales bacterium]